MSMDLGVHKTKTTNVTTFSSYSRFYPKTFSDDNLSCPLCEFHCSNKGQLRTHYVSSFHLLRLRQETLKSARLSLEWERKDGERKKLWKTRTDLLRHIGIPPKYLKVTLMSGYPAFSHALQRSDPNSFFSRRSRGENLMKPVDYAILYGESLGHQMFCAYESSSTSRCFLSFPSFEEFWVVYSRTNDEKKRYQELFVSGHPTREIFDLETEKYEEGQLCARDIFELFKKARSEFEPDTKLEFYSLQSCGKTEKGYKYSLHILTNKTHNDLVSMSGKVKEFKLFLSSRDEYSLLLEMLDAGIYGKNRTMRVAWSVKFGSERRLVPLDDGVDPKQYFATVWPHQYQEHKESKEEVKQEVSPCVATGDSEEFLMDYCETELDNVFDVQQESPGFWRLERRDKAPNHCPICDREHESDNMFAFENEVGLFIGCHRAEKGERTKLLMKNKDRTRSFVKKRVKTDLPQIFVDEFLCSKEVPDFVQRKRTATLLISPMGTGKTKALIRYLSQFPEASVLFVTYRRSLAKELWNKLSGFSYYEDVPGDIFMDRLVVQVDSLHRVKRIGFDIVVCDEATYMLNRVAKYVAHTHKCWKTLKYYLKEAKESFFLDKNMNSTVSETLQRLGIPTYTIKNTFKAHTSRTCFVSQDFVEFKTSLLDDLVSGTKICFASSSKKKLELVCKEAETLGHSVLWYTGDGKSEDVWISSWDKYDLVAYSPTISAGVSYEQKHFDKMYGYFSSRSCCAEECEQMLFRVRNVALDEMVICFDGRNIDVPTTRKGVQEHLKQMDSCSNSLPCLEWDRKSPGCPLDMTHVFTRLYVDVTVRENVSKKDLEGTLLWLLKEQGVRVERLHKPMTREERKDAFEQLEETKDILDKEEIAGFCGAPNIVDKTEFDYLCSLRDRTKEENFSIKKYIFARNLDVEQDAVTPPFFVTYRKFVKQYGNLKLAFSGTDEERKRRLQEMADELNIRKQSMNVINRLEVDHRLERIVYAKRLLKILGFADIFSRKRIPKEEMSGRLKRTREVVLKSRYFQELFGKLPKDQSQDMRWANGVLQRVFGCSVSRTTRGKYFSWYLDFSAPWICNDIELETKVKIPETARKITF
ncbi:putative origin of replication binding protein [Golden Marseillevirus]|uniref:replication n=1 Tax=Golden Marseillevirus TaxID=1720526 RepID=UPI000877ABA2|nr:replication [Golden Marseillevirus]ALX27479.1 putative origin of replication binding protein [Golden Marseillevirus]